MNILDTIVGEKRLELALLQPGAVTADSLKAAMERRADNRDFLKALRQPRHQVALIAEVKKASPSAGVICPNFDPVAIAKQYEAAGADCISVLTDETFFQGSLDYLRRIRAAVNLPLLRKDFIIDERQILQSVENGADAILLIARILDDSQLRDFHELATACGAVLIGINNRNLDTFVVDLATTERLAPLVSGADQLLVAESGIHKRDDVDRVAGAGAKAILVGESLMKNPAGIEAKIAELLAAR